MSTLKMMKGSGCIATTASEAINIIYSGKHRSVIIYATTNKKLHSIESEIYEEIKSRNSKIERIEDQLLPTTPYTWDDIDGCLHVCCAEIGFNKASESGGIYLFSEPMYSCLSRSNFKRPLHPRTLETLALMGSTIGK